MWLKLIPYLAAAAMLIGVVVTINNRGYDRGKEVADKTCAETTVPAAIALVDASRDKNGKTQTEVCNAMLKANTSAAANSRRVHEQFGPNARVSLSSAKGAGGNDGAAATGMPFLRVGDVTRADESAATEAGRLLACQKWVTGVCDSNPGECY